MLTGLGVITAAEPELCDARLPLVQIRHLALADHHEMLAPVQGMPQ